MTTDRLLKWRDEFPILSRCNYLISNSLGAMPRGVYDSLQCYADTWAAQGVSAWGSGWFELPQTVGDKIAPLMGAAENTVLAHQNASIANSILFSALDFSDPRRDKVVITELDFPSDVYALRSWLPNSLRVHMIRSRDGVHIDIDELLDAIDETTRLVSTSHVLFRSAFIMPARAITEKAHSVGAQVLFNGYHSVGVIPVDVGAWDIDYYIGGVLKWLCGGPGGVFMYVRSDLLPSLNPKLTGWFASKAPFDFDVEQLDLREDAYRLMNGTPGIASLHAVQPGVDIIAQVGVSAIREKSMRQTALIIDLADEIGCEVASPRDPERRAGTVTVNPPHAYEVSNELLARDIKIDFRPQAGIRIAPHFYNSDDEIRAAMLAIGEILADGSWRRHSAGQ
ncbi:MAG: aminotransferase class V-fold PLP-dependent enzyme [Chloroflexota bacterium]|nr:aminotransferase class V-fold PLP-dependent enzyme [Chloroflexota bacterium]